MNINFKYFQQYILKIFNHFLKGEFSIGLYHISRKFPNWLFRFNKAIILKNQILSMKLPEQLNPSVKVRIATDKDIDRIAIISNWEKARVQNLMDRGSKCFLSSIDNNPPGALTWLAFGNCYIKGMGFKYNFPQKTAYGVFSLTLPEYRRKGLYLHMNKAIVDYAIKHDVETYYVLVEFTNHYSLNLRNKLGFQPIINVTNIKIFFLKICIVKNLENNKFQVRFFVNEPKGDITVI